MFKLPEVLIKTGQAPDTVDICTTRAIKQSPSPLRNNPYQTLEWHGSMETENLLIVNALGYLGSQRFWHRLRTGVEGTATAISAVSTGLLLFIDLPLSFVPLSVAAGATVYLGKRTWDNFQRSRLFSHKLQLMNRFLGVYNSNPDSQVPGTSIVVGDRIDTTIR